MTSDASFKVKANDSTRKTFEVLDSRLKKTEKNTEHLTGKFKSLNNGALSVKKGLFGIAAAAGAWGVKSQIENAVAYADALAKTSQKLGLTTDELQEYRYAAELSNVEQTALDTSLQRFTRRLGEAAKGEGVLLSVLDEYNISLKDSSGKTRSATDVLNDYADVIKHTNDEKERLRITVKAFDQEGANMVNVLRDGSQGLNALRQSARDTGSIMDSELIRKAEIINDKWETLTHTIGVSLKSALISISDVFVDTSSNAEKMDVITNKIKAINLEIQQATSRGRTEFGGEIERIKQLGAEYAKLNKIKSGKDDAVNIDRSADAALRAAAEKEDSRKLDGDFERLQTSLMTKSKMIEEYENKNRFILEDSYQNGLISFQTYEESKSLLAAQKSQSAIELARAEAQAKRDIASGMMGNLSVLMGSKSRQLFELGKKASVAGALLKGYESVLNSYAAGTKVGGPILGAAFATTAGIATTVHIQKIRGQQFSGARSTGGPVVGGNLYKVNDGAGNPMELFRPNSSGQIISNKNINNGGDNYFSLNIEMQSDAQMDDWADRNQGRLFGYMLETMRERNLRFS